MKVGGFNQENELRCLLASMNGPVFHDLESEVEWSGELIANYCIANKLKTSFGKGFRAKSVLGVSCQVFKPI